MTFRVRHKKPEVQRTHQPKISENLFAIHAVKTIGSRSAYMQHLYIICGISFLINQKLTKFS